jgi:hypothetical protein
MRTEDLVLTGHTVEEPSCLEGRVFEGFVWAVAQGAGPVPAIQDGVALRVERLFQGPCVERLFEGSCAVERSEPGLEGG